MLVGQGINLDLIRDVMPIFATRHDGALFL